MSLALTGIGVSRGVAIGRAHILFRDVPEVPEYVIAPTNVDGEVARYRAAIDTARLQLESIRRRIPGRTSTNIAAFIDTHLLMLEDPALAQEPLEIIQRRRCNAEWALKLQCETLCRVFDQMDDPYLRTRRDDVVHVVTRIQRTLLTQDRATSDLPDVYLRGRIVLADDLTPADMVVLQQQGVAAFVTEYGGPLSHTAILARNLRIPTVVGAHWARRYLKEGELLVVDSTRGVILAEVDDRSLAHYHQRQEEERRYVASLGGLRNRPAVTLDGREVHLRANIELLEDAFAARAAGAQGVGLYRTEFLYMNRIDTPDEEEHLATYLEVLMAIDGGPVTIRTLDLGADKPLATDRSVPTNPALGLRAIRLCLKEPALFLPQLRAILRASAEGAVRILIPMISSVREVRQVLALIDKTKHDLRRQGLAFDPRVPVGGMIEVPAAALIAAQLAQELDFLSIGTNDLIQYTLAIDRVDDEVNYLYDPLHPAILGLVHGTIVAGNAAGVPVSLCGELASDIRYTRILLALGLTDLSIHPGDILDVKRVVTTTDVGRVEPLVTQLLTANHPDQTACLLEAINEA